MTKEERDDFDKMFKAILKEGVMVTNHHLPESARRTDENVSNLENDLSSTAVIPTFKVVQIIGDFVKKYRNQND